MHNAAFRAARARRRLPAARRRGRRRLRDASPRRLDLARRQRHRAVQGRRVRRADECDADGAARSAPSTRCGATDGTVGRAQHRRRRASWRRSAGACRCAGLRARARRRRRGAGGRRGAASPGARVTIARAARRAGRGGGGAAPARRSARGRPRPAAGTCWSTPRRSARTRTSTESPLAGERASTARRRLRPGLQPAATRGCCATPRAAGCRDDRRPRHAGRPGAGQFEWWTGAAPAGRRHARRRATRRGCAECARTRHED